MIKFIVLLLIPTTLVFADSNKYWEIDIPVMDGASAVSHERIERLFIISKKYNIQLRDTESIYNFYKDFFEKMGWENPMKNFPKNANSPHGSWNSFRSAFNNEGLPESSYASMWKAKSIPAIGTVNLTLTGFNEGKFNAKVTVALSPEVDTLPLFELQKLIMRDPRNIFILYEATGGNPLEFDKVNPKPKKEYKNNEIVEEYYRLLDGVIARYNEFGEKYVQR